MREQQQQAKSRTRQVRGHHRRLQRPPVNEHTGQNPKHGNRRHVGNLQPRDLLRIRVQLKCQKVDNREQRQEVAKSRHQLRVPKPPHHRDAENLRHR